MLEGFLAKMRVERGRGGGELMPPITLHMVLARELALGLGPEAILTPSPGHYLLGATTPDIRVITRQDRFSTHFFDLNEEGTPGLG